MGGEGYQKRPKVKLVFRLGLVAVEPSIDLLQALALEAQVFPGLAGQGGHVAEARGEGAEEEPRLLPPADLPEYHKTGEIAYDQYTGCVLALMMM